MKKDYLIYSFLCLIALLSSCSDDEETPTTPPGGEYEFGYFVSNEGPFQNGTGSLTFIGDDGKVVQNVYATENNEELGNIVNSITIEEDLAYIVVNNSNRLVVAEKNTMKKVAVIEGDIVKNPRYFVTSNGIGYLSNWGDPLNPDDDFITVIDLNANTVVRIIGVGEGPEKMVVSNNYLYVCLKGGYNVNNKVAVIDLTDYTLTENLEVGNVPNSVLVDGQGFVWVLCEGTAAWTGQETGGSLYRFDQADFQSEMWEFQQQEHPTLLNLDVSTLYYHLNERVYRMAVVEADLPDQPIDGIEGSFYTMKVNYGELYATDAGDYTSEGSLTLFNLSTGDSMATYSTGIIPGDIAFP